MEGRVLKTDHLSAVISRKVHVLAFNKQDEGIPED